MNAESGFERVQKIVMLKEDARVPKIVVERNGNYGSYTTYLELDDALPQTMQTFPIKMVSKMICELYDAGYKIVEQVNSDSDMQ